MTDQSNTLQLHHTTHHLQLRDAFRISKSSRTEQPTVIMQLSDGEHTGYGEAPAISYYGQSVERTQQLLEILRPKIEAHTLTTPENFFAYLRPYVGAYPFVQAALDVAAHDLYARRRGVSLGQLLGGRSGTGPLTSFTIGIDTVGNMQAKITAQPWPVYKIKLGTPDDVALVRALREVTDSPFRVDANGAWTADEAIDYSKALSGLNVEFIEQPLPVNDWDGMREVVRRSHLPVIADESCQTVADVERCVGHFHGVNIKLSKCGGLTPALKMIATARAKGMKVMAGCMVESTVGIAPLAHLLPLLDYVDMDGPLLITNDPATGIVIRAGRVLTNGLPGTGVRLRAD